MGYLDLARKAKSRLQRNMAAEADGVNSLPSLNSQPTQNVLSGKLDRTGESLPSAWIIEVIRDPAGELRAVQICSAVLRDHLWLIFDATFIPSDDRARYYPDELPALATMTETQLIEAHEAKAKSLAAFPTGRIRK